MPTFDLRDYGATFTTAPEEEEEPRGFDVRDYGATFTNASPQGAFDVTKFGATFGAPAEPEPEQQGPDIWDTIIGIGKVALGGATGNAPLAAQGVEEAPSIFPQERTMTTIEAIKGAADYIKDADTARNWVTAANVGTMGMFGLVTGWLAKKGAEATSFLMSPPEKAPEDDEGIFPSKEFWGNAAKAIAQFIPGVVELPRKFLSTSIQDKVDAIHEIEAMLPSVRSDFRSSLGELLGSMYDAIAAPLGDKEAYDRLYESGGMGPAISAIILGSPFAHAKAKSLARARNEIEGYKPPTVEEARVADVQARQLRAEEMIRADNEAAGLVGLRRYLDEQAAGGEGVEAVSKTVSEVKAGEKAPALSPLTYERETGIILPESEALGDLSGRTQRFSGSAEVTGLETRGDQGVSGVDVIRRRGRSGNEFEIARISDAEQYSNSINTAMADHPFRHSVTIPTVEELRTLQSEGGKMITTPDGSTGLMIKPDGEIGFGFNSRPKPGTDLSTRPGIVDLIDYAVTEGGTWLEAFNTVLPHIYAKAGFKPIAKIAFNPEFAPKGWPYDVYKKFNGGKPDIVFMSHDGVPRSPAAIESIINDLGYAKDYDAAAAMARAGATIPIKFPELKSAADAARARIAERMRQREGILTGEKGSFDPEVISDLFTVGADVIVRGAVRFTDFSAKLIRDYGEAIRPHIKKIWDEAQAKLPKGFNRAAIEKQLVKDDYLRKLAVDGEKWKDWYPESLFETGARFERDRHLVQGAEAAGSASQGGIPAVSLGLNAYKLIKDGDWPRLYDEAVKIGRAKAKAKAAGETYTGPQAKLTKKYGMDLNFIVNVERVRTGQNFTGMKIQDFLDNLEGFYHNAVVDRHMMAVHQFPAEFPLSPAQLAKKAAGKKVTPRVVDPYANGPGPNGEIWSAKKAGITYAQIIQERTRTIADDLGWTPANVQASQWASWKKLKGEAHGEQFTVESFGAIEEQVIGGKVKGLRFNPRTFDLEGLKRKPLPRDAFILLEDVTAGNKAAALIEKTYRESDFNPFNAIRKGTYQGKESASASVLIEHRGQNIALDDLRVMGARAGMESGSLNTTTFLMDHSGHDVLYRLNIDAARAKTKGRKAEVAGISKRMTRDGIDGYWVVESGKGKFDVFVLSRGGDSPHVEAMLTRSNGYYGGIGADFKAYRGKSEAIGGESVRAAEASYSDAIGTQVQQQRGRPERADLRGGRTAPGQEGLVEPPGYKKYMRARTSSIKGAGSWKETVDAARARTSQRMTRKEGLLKGERGSFDPQAMSDLVIIGADHIARGATKFSDWSAKMVDEFGDKITPYLREVYDKSKAMLTDFEDGGKVPSKIPAVSQKVPSRTAKAVEPTPEESARGVSHASVAQIREKFGDNTEPTPKEKITEQQAWDEAVKEGLAEKAGIYTRIAAETKRDLNPAEKMGAGQRVVFLENEIEAALDRAAELDAKGKVNAAVEQNIIAENLILEMNELADNIEAVGSVAGRNLRFQRLVIDKDRWTLGHTIRESTKAKGGRLTMAEVAEHKGIADKITDLTERLKKAQKRNDELNAEIARKGAEAMLEAETKRAQSLSKAERSQRRILKKRDDAIKALADMGFTTTNMGFNTETLYHVGRVAMSFVEEAQLKGATKITLKEIVAQVREKVPELTERDVLEAMNARSPKAKRLAMNETMRQRNELKYQARLEVDLMDAINGVIKREGGKLRSVMSPEVKVLQSKLSDLRAQIYRSGLDQKKLERAIKKLDHINDQLRNNYRDWKKKKVVEESAELTAVREETRQLIYEMKTKDRLLDYQEQIRNNDPRMPEARPRKYVSPQVETMQIELRKLKKQQLALIEAKRPHRFPWYIRELPNAPRELMAGGDMSGLRQNGLALLAHPLMVSKKFGKAFETFYSKGNYAKIENDITNSAHYLDGQRAGLKILDAESHAPGTREEYFATGFSERLPFKIGEYYKAGNRHMTSLGNMVRQQLFDNFMERNPNARLPEMKGAADFINKMTGIGDVGALGKSVSAFGRVFFSIKLGASRFQTPWALKKYWSEPRVRRFIAAELGKAILTGNIILGLAKIWADKDDNVEVDYDPTSADFGKIRIGDTRIDIWGGFQQPLRLMMRLGVGLTDQWGLSHQDVPDAEKKLDPWDLMTRFAQYKLNPMVSIPLEAISGKSPIGEERTIPEKVVGAIVPLFVQDTWEAYHNAGLGYAAMSLPLAFMGIGVNTYPDNEKATRRKIRLLLDEGYDDAALKLRDEWNEANPKDRIVEIGTTKDYFIKKISRLLREGQTAEATEVAEGWNKRHPNDTVAVP